jgi:hypothetical protein
VPQNEDVFNPIWGQEFELKTSSNEFPLFITLITKNAQGESLLIGNFKINL